MSCRSLTRAVMNSANPAREGQATERLEGPEVMDLDSHEPTQPEAPETADKVSGATSTNPNLATAQTLKAADSNSLAPGSPVTGATSGGTSTLRKIASLTRLRGTATAGGSAPSSAHASPKVSDTAKLGSPAFITTDAPRPDPEPPTSRPTTPLAAGATKGSQYASSTAGKKAAPQRPVAPNLVVPSFEDTFGRAPRSAPPRAGVLERTLTAVNSYLFSRPVDTKRMKRPSAGLKGLTPDEEAATRLPKSLEAMGEKERSNAKGCDGVRKVAVIGIHGWFTQGLLKTVMGEPTGTSIKFASMMADAVRKHMKAADMELNPEAVTVIPLQGDGKVADRVDRLFTNLLSNRSWIETVETADVLFIAAHSQGVIVSTHLLARLIEQRHVNPAKTRVCLLGMCGIHNGPFSHLQSTITSSYLHYFETAAAKELFEFQSSETTVSQRYQSSLQICLSAGVKALYVGSVDDQVVPLYSALNTRVSHPSILRALYVDGQAYPRTDFLVNLLTFCVAVRNASATDHNLLTLLSSSVAGSLYGGAGHSLIYEEPAVYDLASRYLFEVTSPLGEPTLRTDDESLPQMSIEPFEAQRWNPYQLPWALRGLLEDTRVRSLFPDLILKLLDDYEGWKPATKTLKDVQFRLQPMTSIKRPEIVAKPDTLAASSVASSSKAVTKAAPRL